MPGSLASQSLPAEHCRARAAAGCALLVWGGCATFAVVLGEPALVQFDAALAPPTGLGAFALVLLGAAHLAPRLWGRGALGAALAVLAAGCALPSAEGHAGSTTFARPGFAALVGLVACALVAPGGVQHRAICGGALVAALAVVLTAAVGWVLVPVVELVGIGCACAPELAVWHGPLARVLARRYAIPAVVLLCGGFITVWVGMNLRAEQHQRIRRQLQFETDHVQRLILLKVPEKLRSLAETTEAVGRIKNPEQRARDISTYLGQRAGGIGVGSVTPDGTITWVQPVVYSQLPVNLTELGVSEAFLIAVREGREAFGRPPRSAFTGQRVLLMFIPADPGRNAGGTVSVIRLHEFFEGIVNTNVAPGYAVELSDHDGQLFGRAATDPAHRDEWRTALTVSSETFKAQLELWPTDDALAREHLSRPLWALLVGLAGTALLALAVHLAQTARRRTAELESEVRERRAAEGALQRSEHLYRSLIENLGQAVFLQNADQRYVAANPQFCRDVDRTESQVVGATDAGLYEPAEAKLLSADVRAVLATGDRHECEREVARGGLRRTLRRVLTPVRDTTGHITGVLGIGWDVTEQRALEAHVNQASKMDAIGQLAGGIAHDFNNLLTAVIGNLDVLRDGLPADSTDAALVDSAQTAAERAAALTQRLLGFARRHQLDWRPVQVNALVGEVIGLLARTIDPLTEIDARPAADVWPVLADPDQLNQVLMNLCLNARDAISGRGRVTVETACVSAAEVAALNAPGAGTGDFVRLRVSDTGTGMTPEVRAKIYEPFFTTKEVGKGTGLGLAMVFAIVRQHKGWIDCWSEVGVGTRFDVYLPRAEPAKGPARATRVAPSRVPGHGTVLVADDEPLVRDLASAALAAGGYRVLAAANGREAVDLYALHRDEVALVVLDLTMPLLSGHEAFRQLLALNPRVRVLFVSGYSTEQLTAWELERMAGFLKKPYRPHELLAAAEAALRAPSRSVPELELAPA